LILAEEPIHKKYTRNRYVRRCVCLSIGRPVRLPVVCLSF
jgi:hypothetical protein